MQIVHITTPTAWATAQSSGELTHPSLASEGFIHCSSREQVPGTLERHFAGRADLVLVIVETDRVGAEIRWESSGGEAYPHIYGTIPVDAVVGVEPVR